MKTLFFEKVELCVLMTRIAGREITVEEVDESLANIIVPGDVWENASHEELRYLYYMMGEYHGINGMIQIMKDKLSKEKMEILEFMYDRARSIKGEKLTKEEKDSLLNDEEMDLFEKYDWEDLANHKYEKGQYDLINQLEEFLTWEDDIMKYRKAFLEQDERHQMEYIVASQWYGYFNSERRQHEAFLTVWNEIIKRKKMLDEKCNCDLKDSDILKEMLEYVYIEKLARKKLPKLFSHIEVRDKSIEFAFDDKSVDVIEALIKTQGTEWIDDLYSDGDNWLWDKMVEEVENISKISIK